MVACWIDHMLSLRAPEHPELVLYQRSSRYHALSPTCDWIHTNSMPEQYSASTKSDESLAQEEGRCATSQ